MKTVSLEITDTGIAVLTLDDKEAKVNVLSSPFMEALEKTIHEVSAQTGVKAAVIRSGKSASFVVGANIKELESITDPDLAYEKSRQGQLIFQRISDLPFPVVAAVKGHCLGGGAELILACDFRVAGGESVQIGFPEVKLGIIPAWGGCQRLARMIPLPKALDMILSGKTYNARKGYQAGLVDKIVPDAILDRCAIDFAEEISRKGGDKYHAARRRKTSGFGTFFLERNPFGRGVLWYQTKKKVITATGGNYPAPLKAMEVVRKGLSTTFQGGLRIEARGLAELITTPTHKNLLHVFHLSEIPKKQLSIDAGSELERVRDIAVLGAGVMGGGIAQLLAYHDYRVRMKDIDNNMVAAGLSQAQSLFHQAVKGHKISKLKQERKMENISGTTRYDGLSRVDLVIEAVVENLEIKKKVLQEAEQVLAKEAIFASNTSALSISELQAGAKHPDRVCGMHFFNPVHRMPLIEVVRGEKTSDPVIATVYHLVRTLGKIPIVVKDSPGFLVNRLLGVYLNEACFLAEEGYDFVWLDQMVKKFGMPMGPFRLMDEVGIDIVVDAADTLAKAFSGHLEASRLLNRAYETGLLGKKGGEGFYVYENGHQKKVNPRSRQLASGSKKGNPTPVLQRMVYSMVNEAARCLQEGIVQTVHDIDTGMIFGTGFPPFRGGLCKYADSEGLENIKQTLNRFARRYGSRFEPAPYLTEQESFY